MTDAYALALDADGRYTCPGCEAAFKPSTLSLSMLHTVDGKVYCCDECPGIVHEDPFDPTAVDGTLGMPLTVVDQAYGTEVAQRMRDDEVKAYEEANHG